jgi:hypothetical protein
MAGPFTVALGTVALLGAAVWNRYPLTFWDTRAYLLHSVTLAPRVDRVIGYSLFIRALSWTGTMWTVVAAQAGAMAWLLWLCAGLVLRRVPPLRFVMALAVLALLSALPWIAGQLMPDVFTPMMLLALFGLIRGWARMGSGVRLALGLIIALAAAVHVTHALFGLAMTGAVVLAGWRRSQRSGLLISGAFTVLFLIFGLAGMMGFNYSRTHRAELVSGGNAFLLAHLVESGLASEVLDAHCGERSYVLCPYRASLPMTTDEFLWQDRLPFHPFDRIEETRRETHRLLADSWREHPASELRVAIDYSLGALGRFGTGEGLDSLALPGLDSSLAVVAPGDLPALNRSRQQHGLVPIAALRAIHTPAGWIMLLGAIGVVIVAALRHHGWWYDRSVQFLVMALAGVIIYAVLCGNTSGIYDRYESRLVWQIGFGLWLAAERATRARQLRRR